MKKAILFLSLLVLAGAAWYFAASPSQESHDQPALPAVAVGTQPPGIHNAVAPKEPEPIPDIRNATAPKEPEPAPKEPEPTPESLAKVALTAKDASLRLNATGRITDQDVLAQVATQDADAAVRKAAVGRLALSAQDDAALLQRVAKLADNEKIRAAAGAAVVNLRAAQFAVWQVAHPDWTGADLVAQFATASGIKLVPIPAGAFTMGDNSDGPVHRVTISRPFFLGATDVTQAQWSAVMGNNPSSFKGDTLPVETVSWDDAMAFCKKLTERERVAGRLPAEWAFTLPTEAQWEYACRAGTTGDYAGDLDAMAWYSKNSGNTTHPVGTKQPNVWGLYDMHGNVSEWCADWYGNYPNEAVTDPSGPLSGAYRVFRGGCWDFDAANCRSAYRNYYPPDYRYGVLGFRLALSFSP